MILNSDLWLIYWSERLNKVGNFPRVCVLKNWYCTRTVVNDICTSGTSKFGFCNRWTSFNEGTWSEACNNRGQRLHLQRRKLYDLPYSSLTQANPWHVCTWVLSTRIFIKNPKKRTQDNLNKTLVFLKIQYFEYS